MNPLLQHHDLVGIANGAKPVCHHDDGPVFEGPIQGIHDLSFIDHIQRIGGLVQEQKPGTAIERPGNEQSLFLPPA